MGRLEAEGNRTSWWLLRSRLLPYVAFALMIFFALRSWRVVVASNDEIVAGLAEQAGWDASDLGYDATPFIKAVAAQVRVAQDQGLVLVACLALVAFLILREVALIHEELWGETTGEASTGSSHPGILPRLGLYALLAAVALLFCALPVAVSELASPHLRSVHTAVRQAPKPVSDFGRQFLTLTRSHLSHPSPFLVPLTGLLLVYVPVAVLRRSICAALVAGTLKREPL